MIKKYYWAIALLLVTQLSCAAVYQWTDAQGRKHYSDKSNERAAELQLAKSYSYYVVKKVYDGDTVQLSDGRKIRLLGINTPEIEHPNQAEQVGGELAKKWLIEALLGKKVRLEFAQEKRDKYQRYLAHIFTEQDVHINCELVRLGFASVNVFPPSLKYVPELIEAEREAEAGKLGIWGYSEYSVKSVQQLTNKNKQGWQRVSGTVATIKVTAKNVYLKFVEDFEVGIKKENLAYFDDLDALKGQEIEVRGWVNRYKNSYMMWIKHSSAMRVL
ncbi:MAG: thermonuclease family protein [Methyloprofundus sp.]|nr:thermonuclease family protein [Methyloprofundus sp.]MDT8425955.1 thermonuclease family protein [Methyloprofundus sp.]